MSVQLHALVCMVARSRAQPYAARQRSDMSERVWVALNSGYRRYRESAMASSSMSVLPELGHFPVVSSLPLLGNVLSTTQHAGQADSDVPDHMERVPAIPLLWYLQDTENPDRSR